MLVDIPVSPIFTLTFILIEKLFIPMCPVFLLTFTLKCFGEGMFCFVWGFNKCISRKAEIRLLSIIHPFG